MSATARRVLVAEDERHLARGISENLELEGFEVEVVHDGRSALDRMLNGRFDLAILDVMMPEIDGLTVCERAREGGSDVPVLFLTARGAPADRIRGLEAGGDDYLPKPFHLRELLLRVAALIRRRGWRSSESRAGEPLRFGGNEVDFDAMRARAWSGEEQRLTIKEAQILQVLAESEGTVVSRQRLLEKLWAGDAWPSERTIDNFIVRLRRRFEREPDAPRHIHTVRGVGYRFTSSG